MFRTHQKGAGLVLVDWLTEKGFPWIFPANQVTPDEECTNYCRWCRHPVSYPGTQRMIRFYRDFTCTSCTPNPSPSLICSELVSKMSLALQTAVVSQFGASYDRGISEDPLGLMESVLIVIDRL